MNNVDLIKAGYADFTSGNIPAVVERFADDINVTIAGAPEVPYAGTFRTRDELMQFFQNLGASVNISVFEPREYFADGDRVIALGHYQGEVRKNGRSFANDWAMAWTIRGGQIVGMQELVDPTPLKRAFGG
ncbi:MAG TPA: nuclear transport factor 2 family protein [Thermoanaerobaculia bacterium]|nr:nuclear transport factor 2 family protein [Thermoanaerobaculia bacterium]